MFTKNCNRQAEPFMTGRGLCPVTGGKDNWSFTNGGLFCVYGDHSALAGWVVVGQASTGGMLYRAEPVGGSASFSSNVVCTSPAKGNTTLQDAAILDLVYRTLLLLMACRLTPQHAENLRARGLKDVLNQFHAQERTLLASLPKGNYPNHKVRFQIIDQLLDLTGLSAEQLSGVPGFYTKNGRVRMSNQYGMLVPYYNVEGQIIGLQVRSDAEPRSGKPRYTWFSSAKDGGPRGGAPVGFLKGDLERSRSPRSRSQDHERAQRNFFLLESSMGWKESTKCDERETEETLIGEAAFGVSCRANKEALTKKTRLAIGFQRLFSRITKNNLKT
jgi:hypothetical protein